MALLGRSYTLPIVKRGADNSAPAPSTGPAPGPVLELSAVPLCTVPAPIIAAAAPAQAAPAVATPGAVVVSVQPAPGRPAIVMAAAAADISFGGITVMSTLSPLPTVPAPIIAAAAPAQAAASAVATPGPVLELGAVRLPTSQAPITAAAAPAQAAAPAAATPGPVLEVGAAQLPTVPAPTVTNTAPAAVPAVATPSPTVQGTVTQLPRVGAPIITETAADQTPPPPTTTTAQPLIVEPQPVRATAAVALQRGADNAAPAQIPFQPTPTVISASRRPSLGTVQVQSSADLSTRAVGTPLIGRVLRRARRLPAIVITKARELVTGPVPSPDPGHCTVTTSLVTELDIDLAEVTLELGLDLAEVATVAITLHELE
jgi:hypothetical protein